MRSKSTNVLLEKAGVIDSTLISSREVKDYPAERIRSFSDFNYLMEDKSDKDAELALLAKQTIYLETIKNILFFFFIISIVSAILGLIYFFI